jgi:hypothetical protein
MNFEDAMKFIISVGAVGELKWLINKKLNYFNNKLSFYVSKLTITPIISKF